jgi:hypothetical protein
MSDVISIGTYQSTADAQIAKAILDGLGIDSMFNQDTPSGVDRGVVRTDIVHFLARVVVTAAAASHLGDARNVPSRR